MAPDMTTNAGESHALRAHPIDQLISPALRVRLAELDPLMNLDRLTRLITRQRSGHSTA